MFNAMGSFLPSLLSGQYGIAIAAVLGTACAFKVIKGWWNRGVLSQRRKQRQQARKIEEQELANKVGKFQLSLEKQHEICTLPVLELQEKIQKGELLAVDVLHAYQAQALKANKRTNAITGYINEAESEAEVCDEIRERSRRMLHGIPVSIKECFPMKGYDCTCGMSRLIGQEYKEDCVLIKVLRCQGGVPFARTNIPQTMLSYDSCNPIYGQTMNPHKATHNAGGSSGGEAALLGAGGSIIGLGSDIGGSIRMPSAFCGTCGLKPTKGRLSSKGTMSLFKGHNLVQTSYGPMARDVDGLVLLMKALLCPLHFELDKSVPPIPFRDDIFNEKRKPWIGYYFDDGYMALTPPMKRAVKEAVEALQSVGYEVVEWKFPDLGRRAALLFGKCIFSDGGKELRDLLQDDTLDHSYSIMYRLLKLCRWKLFHSILTKLLMWTYPNVATTFSSCHGMESIHQWQQVTRDLNAFRQEVEDDLTEKKIDVILAPGFTMPAPLIGQHRYATGCVISTALYNILDYPAGSIPVTKATADDVAKMEDYPTPDPWHKAVKRNCMESEGLPLNVQVVAPCWQEERCLRVMKDLETALKH